MTLRNGGNHRKPWQPVFRLHPDLREHPLAVLMAFSQLTPDERGVLVDHRIRDLRLTDVAREWGCSRDVIRGLLAAADRKLDRIFAA